MKEPKKQVVTRAMELEQEKEEEDDSNCEPGSEEEQKGHLLNQCYAIPSLPTLSLDDIIKRVRENEYVCSIFCFVLVATFVFAILLLADSGELNDVFLVLFGVCALLVVLLGALLQVRNDTVKDKLPRLEFVARDTNGVRAFMILEAVVDIAIGALSLTNEAVVGVTSTAMVFAVLAIAALVVVPWRFRYNDHYFNNEDNETHVFKYHLPMAVVLTDAADVLLLLQVIFLRVVEVRDILLFVFLVLNAVVSEVSTLIAIRAEEKAKPPANEKLDERKVRLEKAIRMRTAMRNKALAQTVVTGTLVIPVVLGVVLYEFLDSPEDEVMLILLPLLSFLFRASETEALCGRWLFKKRLNDSWRDLLARIYVLTCALVLGAYDGALSLEYKLQQLVFFAYAIYIGVPFFVRVLEDWTQHHVNFITTRPNRVADRETDKHRPKLFRSALADAIDNSNDAYLIEDIQGTSKCDPSVAFACYCKYDTQGEGKNNRDVAKLERLANMLACLRVRIAEDVEQHEFGVEGRLEDRVSISCLNWANFALGSDRLSDVLRIVTFHQISELV